LPKGDLQDNIKNELILDKQGFLMACKSFLADFFNLRSWDFKKLPSKNPIYKTNN